MIHDIHGSSVGFELRTLAVVSGHAERAGEVRAQFAAQGETVETRWYASPRDLLAQGDGGGFAAVILFDESDAPATERDETELRGRFARTPLFRIAA